MQMLIIIRYTARSNYSQYYNSLARSRSIYMYLDLYMYMHADSVSMLSFGV